MEYNRCVFKVGSYLSLSAMTHPCAVHRKCWQDRKKYIIYRVTKIQTDAIKKLERPKKRWQVVINADMKNWVSAKLVKPTDKNRDIVLRWSSA